MAKTLSPDRIQLQVYIDGSPARRELADLTNEAVRLKNEQKRLREEERKLMDQRANARKNNDTKRTAELAEQLQKVREAAGQAAKAIEENAQKQRAARDAMDITSMSVSQLRAYLRQLKAQWDQGIGRPEHLEQLDGKMRAVQERINALGTATGRARLQWEEQRKAMQLTSMSMEQLRREIDYLKNAKAKLNPAEQAEQFKQYSQQLIAAERQMKRLESGMGPFARMWNEVKVQVMSAGAVLGAIFAGGAMVNGFRNMVRSAAEYSDAIADVMKTTGLAKPVVKELATELNSLDTRTSRAELLALARDAGKLGLSAKEDVMAFVRAGNQINVALGEDLGDDAIKSVGKLVDLFRLKEEFGLESAMLRVGSAINELGMASTAGEGYMVDFMRRLGGVAPLAGLTADQVLALGATLDSLGQTSEVSTTALSKLFVKLGADTDRYAALAGMTGDAFRKLLQEDVMSAFIAVLEGSKRTEGGLEALSASLADMGIDGSRAAGVFGALSNNTDKLTEQLEVAKKAFEEGTSVTDEYNIRNTTLAATLEKLQKEFHRLISNNRVLEWMEGLVNGTRDLVSWLQRNADMIGFVLRVLAAAGTAWASYRLTLVAVSTAQNLLTKAQGAAATITGVLTGRIKVADMATKAFNATVRNNPIGLLVSAISTAVMLFADFGKEVDRATDAIKSQTKETEDLHKKILLANQGSKERADLINQLKAMYPELLRDLNAETASNQDVANAIDRVNKQLVRRMALRKQEQALEKAAEQYGEAWSQARELELRVMDEMRSMAKRYNIDFEQVMNAGETTVQRLAALERMITQRGEKISESQIRAAQHGGRGMSDTELLAENRRRIEALHAEAAQAKSVLDSATSDYEQAANDLSDIEGRRAQQAAKSIVQLRAEIERIEATLSSPRARKQMGDEEIEAMQARLDWARRELARLESQADAATTEIERTVAWIDEQIKALREKQQHTSTREAYLEIEQEIQRFEAEKRRITGESAKKGRQQTRENLDDLFRQYQQYLGAVNEEQLEADARELAQMDQKHADELNRMREQQQKLIAAGKLTQQQAQQDLIAVGDHMRKKREDLVREQELRRFQAIHETEEQIRKLLSDAQKEHIEQEIAYWDRRIAEAKNKGLSIVFLERQRTKAIRAAATLGVEDITSIGQSRLEAQLKQFSLEHEAALKAIDEKYRDVIQREKEKLAELEQALQRQVLDPTDEQTAELQRQQEVILQLNAAHNQAIEDQNRLHRQREKAARRQAMLEERQESAQRLQNLANYGAALAGIMAGALQIRDAEIRAAETRADADGERTEAEIANIERLKEARRQAALRHIAVQAAAAVASGIASALASTIPFPGNLLAAAGSIATVLGLIAQAKALLNERDTSTNRTPRPAGSLESVPLGADGMVIQPGNEPITGASGGGILGGSKHSSGGNMVYDTRTGKPVANIEAGETALIMSRRATQANRDLIPTLLAASRRGERLPIARQMAMPDQHNVSRAMRMVHMADGGVINATNALRNATQTMGQGVEQLLAQLVQQNKALLHKTDTLIAAEVQGANAIARIPTRLTATVSNVDLERKKVEYDAIKELSRGRRAS